MGTQAPQGPLFNLIKHYWTWPLDSEGDFQVLFELYISLIKGSCTYHRDTTHHDHDHQAYHQKVRHSPSWATCVQHCTDPKHANAKYRAEELLGNSLLMKRVPRNSWLQPSWPIAMPHQEYPCLFLSFRVSISHRLRPRKASLLF